MKIFVLTTFACLFLSCTRLLFFYEGVRKPELETPEHLQKFLIRKEIDTTELLCFEDTSALYRFYTQKIGFPEARFFNRKRQMVDYREKPSDCNARVFTFMEKMDRINDLPADSTKPLDSFICDLAYVKDLRPFQLETNEYDIYLVMYWAKWLGKVNKRKIFEWEKLAIQAKDKGLNIRVIKINADFQQSWGITKEQMPVFDFF